LLATALVPSVADPKVFRSGRNFSACAHHQAIQTFYDLLRWLNGPGSPFETNDCGLRPPRIDHGAPDVVRVLFGADPVVMHGRLTVLYRDLRLNASRPHIDWLKKNGSGGSAIR
jgi:hypothetical protein